MKTEELLDGGENKAVRSFLLMYGSGQHDIPKLRDHMELSGFDGYWPDWVANERGHLTKAGAQLWLRHLFSYENGESVPFGFITNMGQYCPNALGADVAAKERGWVPLFTHALPTPHKGAVPAGYKFLKDSTHAERSWPEDASHENGNYSNTCCHCGREFVGHKRRVVCKVCATEASK